MCLRVCVCVICLNNRLSIPKNQLHTIQIGRQNKTEQKYN